MKDWFRGIKMMLWGIVSIILGVSLPNNAGMIGLILILVGLGLMLAGTYISPDEKENDDPEDKQ